MSKQVSFTQWALEPYCIGMKLRALRNQKRLTLSRLAAETGLSTALLSKIETERMVPTLPTLAAICKVYGVNLSYFFREPDRHLLAVTRRAHLEEGGLRAEPARTVPLNVAQQSTCMVAQMLELSSAGHSPERCSTDVCLFVYVLDGKLQLTANGLSQVLETGDCAYLETQMAVSYKSAGERRCRVLLLQPGPGYQRAAGQ